LTTARRPLSFAPKVVDSDAAFALGRRLGLHPVTAQVLAGRGITEEAVARRFLHPGPETLHDPRLMKDMDRATEAVARAIEAGGRIAVYGDYDVDGVCGTALLLRHQGLQIDPVRSG